MITFLLHCAMNGGKWIHVINITTTTRQAAVVIGLFLGLFFISLELRKITMQAARSEFDIRNCLSGTRQHALSTEPRFSTTFHNHPHALFEHSSLSPLATDFSVFQTFLFYLRSTRKFSFNFWGTKKTYCSMPFESHNKSLLIEMNCHWWHQLICHQQLFATTSCQHLNHKANSINVIFSNLQLVDENLIFISVAKAHFHAKKNTIGQKIKWESRLLLL